MDVRSVTHDTVHDSAKVTSTDPSYKEAVVTSKTKVEGRDLIHKHCTANSTSDFGINFDL